MYFLFKFSQSKRIDWQERSGKREAQEKKQYKEKKI